MTKKELIEALQQDESPDDAPVYVNTAFGLEWGYPTEELTSVNYNETDKILFLFG